MATNNTQTTLRAATVSRLLAKAGVPRATFDPAGFPQCSGFEAKQRGRAAEGRVRVRWWNLMFGRNDRAREQGLGRCETVLKDAGYVTERDGEHLIVSRPVEEG